MVIVGVTGPEPLTVNVPLAVPLQVVTDIVLAPVAAAPDIVIFAVNRVALPKVTLFTVIPAPLKVTVEGS